MASGTKVEGGSQRISAGVQKTIKSIKEIVGNHSDADIYVTLKETNMDPNESVQKLLHQDTFHEVKRRKDKKKEPHNAVHMDSVQPRKNLENSNQVVNSYTFSNRNVRKNGGVSQNSFTGRTREFRVVRDNRVNQNANRETKPDSQQCSTSANEPVVVTTLSDKGSPRTSNNHRPISRQTFFHASNRPTDSHQRPTHPPTGKPIDNQRGYISRPTSGNSVIGVYSSSLDPVHVPSLESRPKVGVVGVRKQSASKSVEHSSCIPERNSVSNPVLKLEDNSSSAELGHNFSKGNQINGDSTSSESVIPRISSNRPFVSNNQYSNKSRQHIVGQQKAFLPSKEWKPKLNQKTNAVVGSSAKFEPPSADSTTELKTEAVRVQDKLENHNVVIAEHIRAAEIDGCMLTFGSIGPRFQAIGSAAESREEPSTRSSIPLSSLESSRDDTSVSKQVDKQYNHVTNSGVHSSGSSASDENQLHDKLESYSDIGVVHVNNEFFSPLESHQQQEEAIKLPSFSANEPRNSYEAQYSRPTMEDSLRGQGLQFSHEALNSTMPLMQQHQTSTHMYPQLQGPHYANLMPYRQFLSPVYVPPMVMSGYSNNPAYPSHPSNGSNYMLMPGGNLNPNAQSLKYGFQQFNPVPSSPTGFMGNFTSPIGYPMNSLGGVGNSSGFEDSSPLKYKDGNLYAPNPQVESSEIWIQNPRELPQMQSASYYNLPTQPPPPHGLYMPSRTNHAAFNPGPQSSHMQFPGTYLAAPPAMGGGGGVAAVAPGIQVGAYQQQPQVSHMNWMANL